MPLVEILEEQKLTGKKVAILIGIVVLLHKLLMVILEWEITEGIGGDLSSAIVITIGHVQPMRHFLLGVVEHLKQWLSVGCVVVVGESPMVLGDKALQPLTAVLLAVGKVELAAVVL